MKSIKFLTIVLLGIITILSSCMALYNYRIKQANKQGFEQWFKNEYMPSEFKGVITSVKPNSDDLKVVTLLYEGRRKSYNLYYDGSYFLKELEKGDSIIKLSDAERIEIKYTNGKTEKTILPFVLQK